MRRITGGAVVLVLVLVLRIVVDYVSERLHITSSQTANGTPTTLSVSATTWPTSMPHLSTSTSAWLTLDGSTSPIFQRSWPGPLGRVRLHNIE